MISYTTSFLIVLDHTAIDICVQNIYEEYEDSFEDDDMGMGVSNTVANKKRRPRPEDVSSYPYPTSTGQTEDRTVLKSNLDRV